MPTKKSNVVSFVMPIKNEEKHLASAVQSIYEQQLPKGFSAEVILALAPSSDKTEAIAQGLLKSYKNLHLVPNPSGLTSAGLNLAISKSSGETIVRVDAHSALEPGYVMAALAELERDPKIGNVGGVMAAEGETDFEKAVAWAYHSRYGLVAASSMLAARPVRLRLSTLESSEERQSVPLASLMRAWFEAKTGNSTKEFATTATRSTSLPACRLDIDHAPLVLN